MMSWINAFELMCYIIVAIMLIDLIRKKDYDALFTFGAAALVGFVMELAAVAVTDIYYYNDSFWLSLGTVPKQFPLFGGFMWGGLTVYGIRLAKKLHFGKWMTAFAAGFFIVTMIFCWMLLPSVWTVVFGCGSAIPSTPRSHSTPSSA